MSMHNSLEDDAMTANCGRIGALVVRMQGDFLETPGLTLTRRGAQHRFGVDETTCEALLGALVDAGVLVRRPDGAYARRFPRPALRVRERRSGSPQHGRTGRVVDHAA
jgi:hypothetical protein